VELDAKLITQEDMQFNDVKDNLIAGEKHNLVDTDICKQRFICKQKRDSKGCFAFSFSSSKST
jgi:hypothetical protein